MQSTASFAASASEFARAALICCVTAASIAAGAADVLFQAHRGGMDEVPENTLAAFEYAWGIPGAVPEVDLRTTRDGVIVCIHDETPARTTDAPEPWNRALIRGIPSAEMKTWDAGGKFSPEWAGARIPTIDEVFDAMRGRPERQIYLDLKDVDLDALGGKIAAHALADRVIFVHGNPATCAELAARFNGARTMTWLSGPSALIARRFDELAAAGFPGLAQLQFHLQTAQDADPAWPFVLERPFLEGALTKTRAAGVALQVRPFTLDPPALRALLDLGITWYVADAPKAFAEAVRKARELPAK